MAAGRPSVGNHHNSATSRPPAGGVERALSIKSDAFGTSLEDVSGMEGIAHFSKMIK